MGTLYLVRHGQASFGSDDYDRLSPLGQRQSLRLGEHWRAHGLHFDAVYTGTLLRQRQTWAGIAQGLGSSLEPHEWPELNEYDSAALIDALHAHPSAPAHTPQGYREHFRLLRDALRQWSAGVLTPRGMGSHADFVAGVNAVLERVRTLHTGRVLIVSSGGPIATAVGQVLGTTPETAIELNLRLRNTALTEFDFNPKRHTLVSFNTLPHLTQPEQAAWVSYA